MKKAVATLVAMVMVLSLMVVPVYASTDSDGYGRSYERIEVKDNRDVIRGYFKHDATIDYTIGWVEYRGLHIYLGCSQELIKQLGWIEAVDYKAFHICRLIDRMEDVDNDSEYKSLSEYCPTVEAYWAWKATQG